MTVISIAIGQGEVNLTPLQIANLASTIANRGYYYIPHVVKDVKGGSIDKKYYQRHYTKAAPWAYNVIVAGMRSSAMGGTCKHFSTLNFPACGKTGTAQNRGQDHSVCMAFAPMDKPKIALAVYVENGGFGADFAVPMATVLMDQYINGKLSPARAREADELQKRRIAYGSRNR